VTTVRLHARSPLLTDQVLDVVFVEDKTCPHPVLRTANGLQMTLNDHLLDRRVRIPVRSPSFRALTF
jgi:hypothetical protein